MGCANIFRECHFIPKCNGVVACAACKWIKMVVLSVGMKIL